MRKAKRGHGEQTGQSSQPARRMEAPPKKQHRATTAIGKSRPIVSIPPYLGYLVGRFIGKLKGDVVITIPEIESLMSDLLCVDTPPTTTTGFSDWARSHADTLGLQYTNELARRLDRVSSYSSN